MGFRSCRPDIHTYKRTDVRTDRKTDVLGHRSHGVCIYASLIYAVSYISKHACTYLPVLFYSDSFGLAEQVYYIMKKKLDYSPSRQVLLSTSKYVPA